MTFLANMCFFALAGGSWTPADVNCHAYGRGWLGNSDSMSSASAAIRLGNNMCCMDEVVPRFDPGEEFHFCCQTVTIRLKAL